MLFLEEGYQTNQSDFDEISNTFNDISSLDIKLPQKNHVNDEQLSRTTKIKLFLGGFSYTGLFLFSLFWALVAIASFGPTSTADIFIEISTYVSLLILLLVFCLDSKKYFLNELKNKKGYLYGIIFAIGIIVLEILVSYLIDYFFPADLNSNQASLNELLENYPTIMILITVFIGPICEELTYRVGLYGLIKEKNQIVAFIVSTLVFAFVHISFTDTTLLAELTAFPIYLVISAMLTHAYKTYGLTCSLVAHMLINLFSIIGVFMS